MLIDQPFERTTLPLCWFTGLPSREGINGTGFGDLMVSWQEQVDRGMYKHQRALNEYGYQRLFVEKGKDTAVEGMVSNGVRVIELDSVPKDMPRWHEPQVVSKTRHRQHQYDHVDEACPHTASIRCSPVEATELGANASGTAQQEEFNRTEDRFTTFVDQYNRFRLRLAEELLNLLDDVIKFDKDF